jgi:hypothetical protein
MKTIQHKFVQFVPDILEDGILYVTVEYRTAVHKCVCGCGNKVVTPISPSDWKLTFDGKTVTLRPSIGNWNFDCRSHYWITNNKIEWAEAWSKKEIFQREQEKPKRKRKSFLKWRKKKRRSNE